MFRVALYVALSFAVAVLFLFYRLPEGGRETIIILRGEEFLVAFSAGAVLSLAGAAFQSSLRNPLAEPYLLGVSAGSGLGAVIGILLGYPPQAGALLGGISAVGALLLVSRIFYSPLSVLLFGVGLTAFLSSLILFAYSMTDAWTLQDALYFTLGFIQPLPFPEGAFLLFTSLSLFFFLLKKGRILDLLSLGDENAFFSGIDPKKERKQVLIFTSLAVALITAEVGIIGFVGLVVPHIVRFSGFRLSEKLLPLSFLFGGNLLVISQLLAKNLVYPTVLPAGVVTTLICVPLFLLILWRYSVVRS
ncbi:MAG: iron ABC transporter permease [Desulfurobacteriaceae bacterium]